MGKELKQTFFQRRWTNGQQVEENTCSASLRIMEMQIKPQDATSHLLECLLSKRSEINADKGVRKRVSLDTDDGKYKLEQPLRKTVWRFLRLLKI